MDDTKKPLDDAGREWQGNPAIQKSIADSVFAVGAKVGATPVDLVGVGETLIVNQIIPYAPNLTSALEALAEVNSDIEKALRQHFSGILKQ